MKTPLDFPGRTTEFFTDASTMYLSDFLMMHMNLYLLWVRMFFPQQIK